VTGGPSHVRAGATEPLPAMSIALALLQLAGALAVFLLGMKLMSEGLQKVAGSRLKGWIARITSNRFSGVLTGLGITLVVQSSTATTVMLVGFVSAGLLTLTQSIGVIMGANIGTTMTAWLVSLLGFRMNITIFALPVVGIGFPMTLMRGARRKQWGEVLIGFGLLFLGLGLIKESVPSIDDPERIAFIAELAGYGFASLMLFVGIGTALTVVLQSSSAATTLTLTLAALGWIPYEMALALILGENVGTTITANLAAIGGSTDAKRAARIHLLFNLVGVTWALLLLRPVLVPIVDFLAPGDPNLDFSAIQNDAAALAVASGVVTVHLAVFHSLFNITNTLVMLPFVHQLERLIRSWVPDEKNGGPKLRYLSAALIETPELLVVQAAKEMQYMAEVVREMFGTALFILLNPDKRLGNLVEETLAKEDLSDQLEREIVAHLTMTARSATSAAAARKIAELIQNTHRLERIADHCAVLVRIAQRIHDSDQYFDEHDVEELRALGELVDQSLQSLGNYLVDRSTPEAAELLETRIDDMRRSLRSRHVQRIHDSTERLETGLAFLDAITHLEEIGDRAVGIVRLAEDTRRM
jgi:phosphate:Na+ symporter